MTCEYRRSPNLAASRRTVLTTGTLMRSGETGSSSTNRNYIHTVVLSICHLGIDCIVLLDRKPVTVFVSYNPKRDQS